jgi:hypothetical protein
MSRMHGSVLQTKPHLKHISLREALIWILSVMDFRIPVDGLREHLYFITTDAFDYSQSQHRIS